MDVKRLWSDTVTPAKATLICFVLGYVIQMTTFETAVNNGVITECRYNDYSALLFGAIGIVTAGYALKEARSPRYPTNLNYAVAAVGILLGIFNLLRGLGIIDSPCP